MIKDRKYVVLINKLLTYCKFNKWLKFVTFSNNKPAILKSSILIFLDLNECINSSCQKHSINIYFWDQKKLAYLEQI